MVGALLEECGHGWPRLDLQDRAAFPQRESDRSGANGRAHQVAAGSGAGTWCGTGSGTGTGIGLISRARASAAVCHRFHAITHMPDRISTPPSQRITYIGLIAIRLSMKP